MFSFWGNGTKNNTKEQVNQRPNIAPATSQQRKAKATFIELAEREYNSKVNPIKQEIKILENKIEELCNMISEQREKGYSHDELLEILRQLRADLAKKEKELQRTMFENTPDPTLSIYAKQLDSLENWNRGVDLYQKLMVKTCQLSQLIYSVERAFGGECNTPSNIGFLKNILVNQIIPNIDTDMITHDKRDRKELERLFYERLDLLAKQKEHAQAIKDKFLN